MQVDPDTVRSIKNPLIYESVIEEIKRLIIEQRLRPGDQLPSENELSRKLGVSRNSVREAVKALESAYILESRRGTGLFVRDFSIDPLIDKLPYTMLSGVKPLADILMIRRSLELALIGDAIAAMTDERIAEIENLLQQMKEQVVAGKSLAEQDRAFHSLLFIDLGNGILNQLFDLFWDVFHLATPELGKRAPRQSLYDDHRAIIEAVRRKDIEAAKKAIEHHYQGIEEDLVKLDRSGSMDLKDRLT